MNWFFFCTAHTYRTTRPLIVSQRYMEHNTLKRIHNRWRCQVSMLFSNYNSKPISAVPEIFHFRSFILVFFYGFDNTVGLMLFRLMFYRYRCCCCWLSISAPITIWKGPKLHTHTRIQLAIQKIAYENPMSSEMAAMAASAGKRCLSGQPEINIFTHCVHKGFGVLRLFQMFQKFTCFIHCAPIAYLLTHRFQFDLPAKRFIHFAI